MSGEKYVNYYIETLSSTLTDCIFRNVSLQATEKVSKEIVEEQAKRIQQLTDELNTVRNGISNRNADLEKQISSLNDELNKLVGMKAEYERTKSQVTHLETFRNELKREREAHTATRNELTAKIEYLQLTPAQRKKIDEKNKPVVVTEVTETTDTVKDGGSF